MELNILAWILLTWFWPLNSAETLPKFNTASGHNCWLSTLSTLSFSAVSELLCSMRCRTTGSHSFMYENGSCEILETYWPAEDIVMYKEYDNTTEREVAKNKPVSASPNYGSDFPPRAVDGDATTFYHSANNEKTPWFMVDLGGGFLVSKVRVLPRPYLDDTHRFVDTQVLVGEVKPPTPGNFSQFTVVGTIEGPVLPVQWQDIEVMPPICARYVVVYKYIEHEPLLNLLELAELEVYTFY